MKKSKYIDKTAIIQVLGNLYNDPSIIDNDNYKFNVEDFYTDFHKILFSSIYNIYILGAKEISLSAIEDYLTQRPKQFAEYKTQGGQDYLLQCSEIANISTFDYYYKRLKKFSLLRAYESIGMDLSWILDMNNILDAKKKEKQENEFDNLSLEDISEKINDKIDNIKSQYVDATEDNTCHIGSNIMDLLDSLKESPDLGVPLYGKYINAVTRGARLGKFYLRSAPTNVGKAIPNDTLIPTPIGWRKVGDIKVGDYLFGQNGKPTKVLKIYPQSEQKDIWEVEFKDGRIAKCCGEHLWEYRYQNHRGYAYRVEDTQTIYERTLKLKNGFKDSNNKGFRFHIKLNEALEYSEHQYNVHPYVMGALLGDGSFRYSDDNKALTFSSKDDKLPSKITSLLTGNYIFKKSSEHNYNYTFKPLNNIEHNLWVEEILSDYPELWQTKSETKFIPKDYLLGSIEQRYELLRGLLDTDGSIDEKGVVRFTTVSPQLRDDVIELTRSLGMVPNYLIDKREDKYTTGECYSIIIQSKKETKPLLFSLDYKVDIATNYANNKKRNEYKDHLAIVDIRKTSEKTDMTCFTVDNADHLFLMNDFIVTHNTRAMIGDACFISCSEMYDLTNKKWIKIGVEQPTLFIATEQALEEIQTMALAFISGVEEDTIRLGNYTDSEYSRVIYAAKVLKESKLLFKTMPDFSLQDVENIIKRNIRENDVKYIFFDYIHTSIGILSEISSKSGGVKLREDNVLFMMSVKIKDICTQYGVFVMSSTQLNADWQVSATPDQNLLRGAKAIADKIDWGAIMLEVTAEDLEKIQPILIKNGFETPNVKMSIYKNRANAHKGEYLFIKANKGICRFNPLFITDWNFKLLDVSDIKISVNKEV